MPITYRVSMLGLNSAERQTIAECLRMAAARTPSYALAVLLNEGEIVIADAGHPPSVQLVVATERLPATLFVGEAPPPGSVACISRPINPEHLLRELDFLVGMPKGLAAARLQASAASRWKGENDRRSQGMPAPTAPQMPELPAPTALLVDDSEIALRFLETRLQRWGMVMDSALASGRAIDLLARRNYDFVFLDLDLGPASALDGLALCHHIKRHQDAAQALSSAVFMVSAHCSQMDRVRGTLAGFDAYLGKPLDDLELQRLLLRHGLPLRAQAVHPAG